MEISGSLSVDAAERNAWNGTKKYLEEKLPHDLVIEILSWLHIKHLWPLRCVSKAWLHLLTKNPQFAKLQFDRFMNNHPDPSVIGSPCRREGKNDSNLFIATDFMSCEKAFAIEFPFYQPTNNYQICGVSNGLICISSFCNDKEVYIWNPFINDHITIWCLPEPEIRFPGNHIYTEFGFGFVEDSNVYKMVRIFDETNFDKGFGEVHDKWRQISVYTIGVDSIWRIVEVDIRLQLAYSCSTISLVNGRLHWHGKRLETTPWDLIVTFDLKDEVSSEFLLLGVFNLRIL